ncbi:hypothetical protein B0D95_02340 [Cellvibrio sp. PSBB023]|nr:hypothetical protein B0D95_02340 [Cellvibrio sp. PSBB023]
MAIHLHKLWLKFCIGLLLHLVQHAPQYSVKLTETGITNRPTLLFLFIIRGKNREVGNANTPSPLKLLDQAQIDDSLFSSIKNGTR